VNTAAEGASDAQQAIGVAAEQKSEEKKPKPGKTTKKEVRTVYHVPGRLFSRGM
jgi:hypothetical protein